MADLEQMLDQLTAETNRETADILDRIRERIGKDGDIDEWNALIHAASDLRIEASRRDPNGELYKYKAKLDALCSIGEAAILHGLRERALKGTWANGGRGGVDLMLTNNDQQISLQLIFKRSEQSGPVNHYDKIREARVDVATVALALRGLNAVFNPPIVESKENNDG